MKLGLAVEMRPRVFNEQLTSCERMSHAASADSLLLSTCTPQTQSSHLLFCFFLFVFNSCRPYLEADVLQMVGVPFDDLFDEVWVRGLQVGAGGLVQLELEAAPQLGHVEGLVPSSANLRFETS